MSSDSLLQVDIQHRVGTLRLAVKFELRQPWTVLFGPSGSGKTTVLRAIAGFVKPDAGRIACKTKTLVDRAAGISLPAHIRPVRSAGQSAPLFPHMSVLENLAYGTTKQINGGRTSIVDNVVNRFQLASLTHRSVSELSGGERQRIAILRAAIAAVATGPHTLLLLDEPFTGFDLPRREEFALELSHWLNECKVPVLSVTHDVGEVFQLEPEVIRIAEGRVVTQGLAAEALSEERGRLLQQLGRSRLPT